MVSALPVIVGEKSTASLRVARIGGAWITVVAYQRATAKTLAKIAVVAIGANVAIIARRGVQ